MSVAIKLIVLVVYCVNGIRISPKLDFGDSSSVRPIFSTANYEGLRPSFQNPGTNVHQVDCIGNNCQTTRMVKSDTSGSASAEVVVHVKTNVNIPNTKNETVNDVPDVPIIVGSNGPALYPEHPSYPIVPPENFNPNYPPSSIDGNVIPGFNRRGLIPENNFPDYNGYVQNNNGFNYDHYNRRTPPLNWYPQPREGGGNHNPLEFKKTYKNVWPTGFENEWTAFTNKRHVENSNPSWAPCLCDNQPLQEFSIIRKLKEWNQLSGQ